MTLTRFEFHVLAPDTEHIASTKCPEEAGMLIGCLGDGYTLQYKGMQVWCEGEEDQPAAESYDRFAETVYERIGPR